MTEGKSPIPQPDQWKQGWNADRSKFRFVYLAHKFTLFKRSASPHWQVKFRDKGKQRTFSLETPNVDAAKKRAQARYDQVKHEAWFGKPVADAVRTPAPFATLGQVLDRYEAGIESVNQHIKAATITATAKSLERLLNCALGKDPRALSVEVLNGETVAEFRANYLAPAGNDVVARERRKRGGDSVLRQARAIFSDDAMRLYRSLRLPDLGEFRTAKGFEPKRPEVVPIGEEQMGAMAAAARALKKSDPVLYVAHLCFRHLGMRNAEIAAARWGWLEKLADGSGRMAIVQRADFDPKGSLGRVPVAGDVMAELEAFRRKDADFLVHEKTETDRRKVVDRRHSQFVKPFLPARASKTSYELRRWAYSKIRRKYGKDAAEAFVRHSDSSTGGVHYWEGFDWTEAAAQREEDAAMAGITLADVGGRRM